MRVRDVEFAGAIGMPGQAVPGGLPQIAIAGRSNVGKSSLINTLIGRKRLARVSKTPGKTREINFYEVNGRFFLVDLPGYGFARVPAEVRQQWRPLIESYLGSAPGLLGVILLIDSRHGPTEDDREMVDFLALNELPALFVLTKIDKLKRSERKEKIEAARDALGVPPDQLMVTSAVTGEGKETLLDSLGALLDSERRAG